VDNLKSIPTPVVDRLLRPEEAAQLIGCGRSYVWQLIADGSLASVHVGRLRRIPASAVAAYIAARVAEAQEVSA
jgi:excisionase family DNA binding protein